LDVITNTVRTGTTQKNKSTLKRFIDSVKKEKYLWLLILPGIIWYIIFAYIPMYGLIIAFKDFSPYRGIAGSPWVGFMWFEQFLNLNFSGN